MPRPQIEHGTYTCYVKRRCRLPECKAAAAEYKQRRKQQLIDNPQDMKHGTRVAYEAGCRCDACKDIGRIKLREFRGRKAVAEGKVYIPRAEPNAAKGEIKHGTVTGYVNGGCREDCCRRAYSDYRKGRPGRVRPAKVKSEVQAPPKSEVRAEVKSQPRRPSAAEQRRAYLVDHSRRLAELLEDR